jgi:hypothetical protein
VTEIGLVTEIRRLVDGYQVSQAICVAATLGLADLLAQGARASDELAEATGTHPGSLYRLLRALASVGVLRELDNRRFALTPLGEPLRSDVPDSIAGWAAFIGRPYHWQAWAELLHSVRTGENAFQHIHGTDVWNYRAARPEESAIFDRAMTSLSRQSNATVLPAYDFGQFKTVVDVGGGNGALLAAVLAAHPNLRGVLFDQPHVVSGAHAMLESTGVADRCQILSGTFFDSVPDGGDGYILSRVIHDWEDEDSVRILRNVRRAITEDGRLVLIERVLAPPNEGRDAKFRDLLMLVSPGGRERTREEYADLLQQSGFALARIFDTDDYSVIEAEAA